MFQFDSFLLQNVITYQNCSTWTDNEQELRREIKLLKACRSFFEIKKLPNTNISGDITAPEVTLLKKLIVYLIIYFIASAYSRVRFQVFKNHANA